MLLYFKQLFTLIWKNFKSKKPNKATLGRNIALELAVPFLFIYLQSKVFFFFFFFFFFLFLNFFLLIIF